MKSISRFWLLTLAAMTISIMLTSTVLAATFDYFGINHSIYEDGRNVYRISFTFSDGSGNTYNQDILDSLVMSDNLVTYNTDQVKFHSWDEYSGRYNDITGEIDYTPVEIYSEYYGPIIGNLTYGDDYKLTASVTPPEPGAGSEILEITRQWSYNPVTPPVVSSTSFQVSNDDSGNFIFKWDAPAGLNDSTQSRISIATYSGNTIIGDIYVSVPTDYGQVVVPASIVQEVEDLGGTHYELEVNVRTNDGRERTYSNRKIIYSLKNPNRSNFPWTMFLPTIINNSQQ